MIYQVLGIGFEPSEQKEFQKIWQTCCINLEFSNSATHAQQLLLSKNYAWAIFNSRMLDSLSYIDIMRNINSVPILIITPDSTNEKQAQLAKKYLIKAGQDFGNVEKQAIHAFTYGDLYFCQEQRAARVCGQDVNLTMKEFNILSLLVSNPNKVFTYEMMIDLIWQEDHLYCSRKTVTNHVNNLRKKLKITPDVPDYIKSVYGVGYKFDMT